MDHWEEKIKEEASLMPSLSYISLDNIKLGEVHPIWRLGSGSGLEVAKATIQARLLTQRYPLYSGRTSGSNYGKACPLCRSPNETTEHFLLQCAPLNAVRYPTLNTISTALIERGFPSTGDLLVKTILDGGSGTTTGNMAPDETLHKATRHLCFKLHQRRGALLEQRVYKITRHTKYRL